MRVLVRQIVVALMCCGMFVGPIWAQGYPAPVKIATVDQRLMAPAAWVAGEVVSKNQAQVSAEVESRLTWVSEEGSRVNAGDVVARLEDTLFKLTFSEAKAQVEREQARLTFLKQEVERLQRLALQNNAARNQLDETLAERDAVTSALEAANIRAHLAQEHLDRTLIRAPFDGVVVVRHKRVGEWVSTGTEVVALLDADNIEIEASVSLALNPFIRIGRAYTVMSSDVSLMAKLRVLVPTGEGDSRLMRMKLDLPEDHDWLPGQHLRVAVPMAIPRDVLAMPRDALVMRAGGNSVYRVKSDNTAEKLTVETGIAVGDYIEVLGQVLQAGDQVIVRGGERLRPGQTLRILNIQDQGNDEAKGGGGQGNASAAGEKSASSAKVKEEILMAEAENNKWWPAQQQSKGEE